MGSGNIAGGKPIDSASPFSISIHLSIYKRRRLKEKDLTAATTQDVKEKKKKDVWCQADLQAAAKEFVDAPLRSLRSAAAAAAGSNFVLGAPRG